jgi:hypothetical protein
LNAFACLNLALCQRKCSPKGAQLVRLCTASNMVLYAH